MRNSLLVSDCIPGDHPREWSRGRARGDLRKVTECSGFHSIIMSIAILLAVKKGERDPTKLAEFALQSVSGMY